MPSQWPRLQAYAILWYERSMMRLKTAVLFLVTVGAVVLVLMVVNWFPLAVKKDTVRRYSTLEGVREELGRRDIYLPSYFPQSLRWPPSEIYASKDVLLMHFTHRETGELILSLSQTARGAGPLSSRIEPERIIKEDTVLLKGREVRLSLAVCGDGRPCNKALLGEGGYTFEVIFRGPVEELRKITESLLPEGQ